MPIQSNAEFWTWFQENEKEFYDSVKNKQDIENRFFAKLSPKLIEIKPEIYFLTGMYDDQTVELILTADGDTTVIPFIEDLVAEAPQIKGWKFTALKPSMNIDDIYLELPDLKFNKDNLNFYANEYAEYPDEIDITIAYDDYSEEKKEQATTGIYIFLDNYIGERDMVNNIDRLEFINKKDATKELIPISKLKDYVTWRQKEFVEKYKATKHDTENDEFVVYKSDLEDGSEMMSVIDKTLMDWDSQASHPWVGIFSIRYNGSDNQGMPKEADFKKMDEIEDEMMKTLVDKDGYLNVGRQTGGNQRDIFFASKDFRLPAKVFYAIKKNYGNEYEIGYNIYKDKYWQTFNQYRNSSQPS